VIVKGSSRLLPGARVAAKPWFDPTKCGVTACCWSDIISFSRLRNAETTFASIKMESNSALEGLSVEVAFISDAGTRYGSLNQDRYLYERISPDAAVMGVFDGHVRIFFCCFC
jgi:hypothetical protein